MPGEARLEGRFPAWSPERAYAFVEYALRKEGSQFLEERRPEFLSATQGKGRLLRTFAVALEEDATGTYVRIRVTSPEDWPVHARAALRRIGVGLAISTLGVSAIAVSLTNRLAGWPMIGSIVLLSAAAPVIVTGWARWRHATNLMRGQRTASWLS